jgi:hypothetical protein
MKVLVLEDNKPIAHRIADALVRGGCEVTVLYTYAEAKKKSDSFDAYYVGYLNGVLGPDFAIEMVLAKRRVIMVGETRKFSKMPFLSWDDCGRANIVLGHLENVAAGT